VSKRLSRNDLAIRTPCEELVIRETAKEINPLGKTMSPFGNGLEGLRPSNGKTVIDDVSSSRKETGWNASRESTNDAARR